MEGNLDCCSGRLAVGRYATSNEIRNTEETWTTRADVVVWMRNEHEREPSHEGHSYRIRSHRNSYSTVYTNRVRMD